MKFRLLLFLFFLVIGSAVSAQHYSAGQKVQVEWQGKWYPATIEKVTESGYTISYDNYGSEWNETVTAQRIKPLQEQTQLSNSQMPYGTDLTNQPVFFVGVETIWEIAVSPNGKYIAAASAYGNVRLLNASDLSLVKMIQVSKLPLFSVTFSYDSKYFAVGGHDAIEVFNTTDGSSFRKITEFGDAAKIRFSNTDYRLLVSAATKTNYLLNIVAVYDVEKGVMGKTIVKATNNSEYLASGLDWSSDSKLIITGISNAKKGIEIYDSETGLLKKRINHKFDVTSVDISSDGKFIVSGGIDNIATVWDAETGVKKFTCDYAQGYIYGVAVSNDNKSIAVCGSGSGSQVKIFDATNGKLLKAHADKNPGANSVVFFPDNSRVAVSLTTMGDIAKVPIIVVY